VNLLLEKEIHRSNVLDLRNIPIPERCLRISTAFQALFPNDSFVLYSDVDPELHHCHLRAEIGKRVHWELLEKGPSVWKILITKMA
jgi:uncharacterized protein (DUF2249 family)